MSKHITNRIEHLILLGAYYVCIGICLFVIMVAITGCSVGKALIIEPPTLSRHSLDGWIVEYTTHKKIKEICENKRAIGCAVLSTRTIYCVWGEDEVCGHELRHITHWNFH